ncbi:M43 family zinc metalloprotease [Tenacibaculum xiamenense]|uniref:M43 family zinc metalloprotease n=1 Tax=Tenacibaculum xiamenense TaxID=1261553 RepID=UPI0038B56021
MNTKKLTYYTSFILLSILFFSCSKDDKPDSPPPIPASKPKMRIPIVVHVVNYAPDPFEISDEKIKSQIEVLNKDFRKLNDDWQKTPDIFIDLVADIEIEFYLATTAPDGTPTNGILRNESNLIASDGVDQNNNLDNMPLYFTQRGGQDAWPNDQYLNIWIADYKNRDGGMGLPGYANPPGTDPRIDGVVIEPRVFGTLPPLYGEYKYGRTATHEIGHWLNLKHIYGTQDSCEDSPEKGDYVDDTPTQFASSNGKPAFPKSSCGSIDMTMNFMDYSDDDSMYMFTKGQKARMWELFAEGGLRRKLFENCEVK